MSKKTKPYSPIIPVAIITLIAITALYAKTHSLAIAKGDDSQESQSGETSHSTSATNSQTSEPSRTSEPRETSEPTHSPEPKETPEPTETPEPKEIKENEFELSDDKMEIESSSVSATSKFPLNFDKTTNTLTVDTGNGVKQIRILPDEVASIATTAGIVNQINKIEIQQGANNEAVFNVDGIKTGKLLGIFTVNIPITSQIDAQTGQVLSTTNQSFILALLAPLIR